MNSTISVNMTEGDSDTLTLAEQSVIEGFWSFGIFTSCVCLMIQIALYILIPKSRKFDEKILTQMTVARLIFTVAEFLIIKEVFPNGISKDVTYALYLQSEMALICWMFLFTKNLYDKVVIVFTLEKRNFIYISIGIWLVTIPLGAMCPWLLAQDQESQYMSKVLTTVYKVYTYMKFIVLLTNVLFFCRIFFVVYSRGVASNRNIRNILKTCIVSFILVCTSSLQVLVTDVLSYSVPDNMKLAKAFCVINSYQIVTITIIFFIVVTSKVEGSFINTVKTNYKDLFL